MDDQCPLSGKHYVNQVRELLRDLVVRKGDSWLFVGTQETDALGDDDVHIFTLDFGISEVYRVSQRERPPSLYL